MPDFRDQAMNLLSYDPDTGLFHWKEPHGRQPAGVPAGSPKDGYVNIRVLRRHVRAQRLAWLFMTGSFPPSGLTVDHKNRVRNDNRWSNLRLATIAENTANQSVRSDNTSGHPGVYEHRNGRFYAYVERDGKRISLGGYATRIEAAAVRKRAEAQFFGEFAPQHGS